MVVLQKIFKLSNFTYFQNFSNLPYWIFKTHKKAIFSGLIQNYCCYNGKIDETQLSTVLFSGNRP